MTNTEDLKRGRYEFPQNNNFVVLLREGQAMPILSSDAIELLEVAKSNAERTEGWSILPWNAKVALVQNDILRMILRIKNDADESKVKLTEKSQEYLKYVRSMEPFAWEVLDFLNYRVVDVYPFRDNTPD